MESENRMKELMNWLLAGEGLSMPLSGLRLGNDGLADLRIDIHETPESQRPKTPEIEYVRGNTVRGKYLGWADYETGRIEIPDFEPILEEVNDRMKPLYARHRAALQRYIAGHEVLEQIYQPQTELAHGTMEARNMEVLESADHEAYMAGLALHRKRLEEGGRKEKVFSKSTSRNYDLDGAFKRYEAELDEWVGRVSDVISGKPTYSCQADSAPDSKPETYTIGDYRASQMREAA